MWRNAVKVIMKAQRSSLFSDHIHKVIDFGWKMVIRKPYYDIYTNEHWIGSLHDESSATMLNI